MILNDQLKGIWKLPKCWFKQRKEISTQLTYPGDSPELKIKLHKINWTDGSYYMKLSSDDERLSASDNLGDVMMLNDKINCQDW